MKNAKQSKGLKEVVSLVQVEVRPANQAQGVNFISPDRLPLSREMKAIHKFGYTERIRATADHISGDLNAESLGGGRPA